jgi:PAS domain-containing protein
MRLLSVYFVPIGVLLVSVLAYASWNSHYVASGDVVLPIRVLAEAGAPLDPASALRELAQTPAVERYDTHLSEAPVWFALRTQDLPGAPHIVEFPSRHAIDISCWDAASLVFLGSASHEATTGALSAAKAGFVLRPRYTPSEVLCRAHFTGPARLNVVQWPASEMTLSIQQFHRKSGLLDGGMIVLSLFILITALINRQLLYLEFAAWLILNLRVGAISAGWDIQWLGQALPAELAAAEQGRDHGAVRDLDPHAVHDPVRRRPRTDPLRPAAARHAVAGLTLLPLALWLPFGYYLPAMWVIVAAGLTLMTSGLINVMLRDRARVAMWFAASFGVTFLSSLAEVISAALGMREVLDLVNSVTAALASSLLAALAIAEQMRLETQKRIAAQAELEHAYEAMPVGLFTLDQYGGFLSANPALLRMLACEVLVPGRTRWQQFFSDATWSHLREQVHSQLSAELEIDPREGDRRFLVRATLAHGRIEGVLEDITEKTKATEQLRFMANNDPLTKVFNRRGIEKMFETVAATAAPGRPLTLAYLDLDRFKLIMICSATPPATKS